MSHSYFALGAKERHQDVGCNYFCQLQFRLQKYIQTILLKSSESVLYCRITRGKQNSSKL